MPNLNKVLLIGNLTRDPELKYIPNGTAVAGFGLATNRVYMVEGEKKEEVCFIDITTWAKTAESCANYLHKGSLVFIEGRLKFDSWETDDGQKRSKLSVVADRVQFLGGRQEAGATDDIPAADDIPF